VSGLGSAPARTTGARVLVLGRSPEVLETVMQELADAGCAVQGSIDAERAAEQFDARDFELIAFGGGLRGPLSEHLKQAFALQNLQVRLLDTFAPQAAWQIMTALDGAWKRRMPRYSQDTGRPVRALMYSGNFEWNAVVKGSPRSRQ